MGAGRWDRPEATPFPAPLAASTSPSWPDAVAATTTPVPTPRWLRPAVAALVLLLAGLDLLVTLVELMLAPLAGAVVVAAWLAELAGLRWPRLVFAAAIVAPNLVLAAAAHNGLNFLFLLLLVAWMAYTGSRAESVVTLVLSLAPIAVAALVDAADGRLAATAPISWTVGIVALWLMTHLLGGQQRLLVHLRRAQADLARQARENAQLRAEAEQRVHTIEALYRADEELYRSLHLDDVLQALVDVVTDILPADACAVSVWDAGRGRLVVRATRGLGAAASAQMADAPGEGIAGQVLVTGHPIAVEDVRADDRVKQPIADPAGIRALLAVPIMVGGDAFGVFEATYCQPRSFSADEVRLVQALAGRAALAIENARLYEQAQQVATLQERQRLARELHDSVTQSLFSLTLLAEAGRHMAAAGRLDTVTEYLSQLGETAHQALKEMRLLVYELRPLALEAEGLAGALQQRLDAVERRAGVQARLLVDNGVDVPAPVQEGLYRIAQEALNNTLKHAAATAVTVRLGMTDGHVELRVVDNGRGFEPTASDDRGGLGLVSMRERAERLGGSCLVQSAPGAGTTVQVSVPLATGTAATA